MCSSTETDIAEIRLTEILMKQTLKMEDVADRISFRIHTVSRLIQQMSRRTLKSLDLTPAQWRALMGVCTESGMTLQKLTQFAQISQPLMSQAVKSLEGKGLVSRSSPANDRRVSVLVATPEGLKLGEQAYAAMLEVEEHLVSCVGDRDSKKLKNLLDNLISGCAGV